MMEARVSIQIRSVFGFAKGPAMGLLFCEKFAGQSAGGCRYSTESALLTGRRHGYGRMAWDYDRN